MIGIGPADHLKYLGIPVISDLPVGDNLQDHTISSVDFIFNSSVSYDLKKSFRPLVILDYYLNKKNQLASNLLEAMIFVKTKYENQRDDSPDIQLHMIPGIRFQMT
jgi:choline dehydrogenase